jgi:ABC-type lipoprotein release transport system permease subunit
VFRSLAHYWRINLAVMLGGAVATSVLTGALMVGDSVRGSLRDLTLDRLGRITDAVVADRFFREDLAVELGSSGEAEVAPIVILRGAAVTDSGARASRVAMIGADERFAAMYGDDAGGLAALFGERLEGQLFPSVVVNDSLRRELGVEVGDSLVLSFTRFSYVPRDSLMGDKDPDDVLARFRVSLVKVVPDRGVGRFGLSPHQGTPLNAFVALEQIQRVLGQQGSVNGAVVETLQGTEAGERALHAAVGLSDYGVIVERGVSHFDVASRELVLRDDVAAAIVAAAAEVGAPAMPIQTYLANTIVGNGNLLPYSMVAAVDPLGGPGAFSLTLEDGSTAPPLADDGIYLSTWASKDLSVRPGDTVEIAYYVVGPHEELSTATTELRLDGVVEMEGLAADRDLVPDYPGLQEAEDISAWDPPFPVDLRLIREGDEEYWDEHGATPKAFVSAATGKRLWTTRFGSTTSVRIGAVPGKGLRSSTTAFREALLARLDPAAFGFRFRPVRQQGLEAAAGATDFAQLFIGFSFFLIVSSALLIGLLFGLGVQQRAGEIGLLRAVGYRMRTVRVRLLGEGAVLACLGAAIGVGGGIGYAWLMMAGLRTLWLPAVGSTALYLHIVPASLVAGWGIAVVVILTTIAMTIVRIGKVPPPVLLAGSTSRTSRRKGRRLAWTLALSATVAAVAMVFYAISTGALSSPGIAFGTGALLLVAGLSYFAAWCRGGRKRGMGPGSGVLVGMAARNSSWNPGRSMLSVALVGSACFVIVAVAANRQELGDELMRRDSGAGGFALVAEADVPIHGSLRSEQGRRDLGLSHDDSAVLSRAEVFPFRVLPGEDASCLNLYRPEKPAVLGVPDELIRRGGFSFQATLDIGDAGAGDNPWSLLNAELEPGVIPAFADAGSAQWILHVELGEDVVIEDDFGKPARLRLVGFLAGSIFQSELLIAEERFLAHFPSRGGDAYFLIDAPWDEAAEVSRILESALGPFGFDSTTTRERLMSYKAVEHTYLSTFQALGGLGLLLGTVGLGIVLVRNVIERRGELATLRAFGFRRATLVWLVLAENAFLLAIGMLIGTLSALAAVAPRLTTVHVPWGSLLATLGVVLVVGMLSSAVAVNGALRVPLLSVLKAER